MDGIRAEKKILYITYDGLTDPLGQSQVLPYLVGLSKQEGWQFFILSFEKKIPFSRGKRIIEEICREARITWISVPFRSSPPLLAKIYDRLVMKKKAKELYQQYRFDLVHCRSYPAAEVGLYLKLKFGVRFLFDMRGFWPDEKIDGGHWNQKWPWYRWVYRHYKKLEKEFLAYADHVISLTAAGKKELIRRHGSRYSEILEPSIPDGIQNIDEKISVIPCCADLDHFDFRRIKEADKQALKKELGIHPKQKILSYSGSLGTWYMMDEMLQFFKVFKKKYPSSVFLCLTKEPKGIMGGYIERNGIDPASVITLFSSRADLPLYLSLSDYSVFFIRPTYSKISSSPTKHAELMGLGIPVFCNDLGDTGSIVQATDSGVVIDEFTDESYTKAINKMIGKENLSAEKIRKAAFAYFDLTCGTERYKRIYKSLLA